VPNIPPQVNPNVNITPEIPSRPTPMDTNENKKDSHRENIPPQDISKFLPLNRETLSIYRPFN
jgi:hypothetical protein